MLYINPESCIDCGACVDACPVEAICHSSELRIEQHRFLALNRNFYIPQARKKTISAQVDRQKQRDDIPGLNVAIVGSGPAAMYAAEHLVHYNSVQVHIYERLGTPFGLTQYGLAPDHLNARMVKRHFARILAHDRVHLHLNVEIGRERSHAELLDDHSAVIYATGAFNSKQLSLEGSALANVHSATEFVAWYNAHPTAPRLPSLPAGRSAVVIGTGNVALDSARMLLLSKDSICALDLEPNVKSALMASQFNTVFLVGRSDPLDASFSYSELQAFLELDDVDVEFHESCRGQVAEFLETPDHAMQTFAQHMKKELFREIQKTGAKGRSKRLILLFGAVLLRMTGDRVVDGLELRVPAISASTSPEDFSSPVFNIPADFVVTAIGFRGEPIADLPFDAVNGTMRNVQGRVIDPLKQSESRGVYVAGWIKRGARGVIGTNKQCSLETVNALIEDFKSHKLRRRAC